MQTWYLVYALPWPWEDERGQRFVAICYSEEKAVNLGKDVFNWNIYEVQVPNERWDGSLIIPMTIPLGCDKPEVTIR